MRANPERVDMSQDEIEQLRQQAKNKLDTENYDRLNRLVGAYETLTDLIEDKNMSLKKLRKMLFGDTSEKTKDVIGADSNKESPDDSKSSNNDVSTDSDANVDVEGGAKDDSNGKDGSGDDEKKKKPPPKGHGRNGAKDHDGAERIPVPHEKLKHGDPCPKCSRGSVYKQRPGILIRFTGQAPLGAKILELEKYRCGSCGEIFTAKPPVETSNKKYDASAVAMIAILKYGKGMPFYRLAGLQESLGIPLPTSTQWDLVSSATKVIEPVVSELIRFAAQGDIFHNDDTGAKILSLKKESAEDLMLREELPPDRKGIDTTGIVSITGNQRIALYFTARKHAGENLDSVLSHRDKDLPVPIQMCDGLSLNIPENFATLVANCIPHGRRKFVDIIASFPDECRHVLELFAEVYRIEAATVELKLTPTERLEYHQKHSAPIMDEFWEWCKKQIEEKLTEPNSALGKAIKYMTKRRKELTLFLREPGAPLDNNICERILKKAILHRKNALFFKTRAGAKTCDGFMSLIHTTELGGGNPLNYLTALLENPEAIARKPEAWLPWNYLEQCLEKPSTSQSRQRVS